MVCSAASGLLLYLAFPPADLGPLAFIALAPALACAVAAPSALWATVFAAVASAFAYLPSFCWVASVAPPGWVGLAGYVGLYLIAAVLACRLFRRLLGPFWPVTGAMAWVALELIRANLGPGFPWLSLGYTQWRLPELVQVAAVGGVYAVSFVVFLVNAAIAELALALLAWRHGQTDRLPRRQMALLAASLLLLLTCAAAGAAARSGLRVSEGPRVGVVQQNIPRLVDEIFADAESDQDAQSQADKAYREMTDELQIAAQLSSRLADDAPCMVCWPETTVQVPLNLAPDLLLSPVRDMVETTLAYLASLGAGLESYFLVGAPTYFPRAAGYVTDLRYGTDVRDFGNSAVLFSPQGRFIDRYDKMRLVPFGEYIPLRKVLPFLAALTPISREITPGSDRVLFTLPARNRTEPVRFAALICYEDVFADLTRAFRRDGAQFFVNLTDEGWYYIPGELRQHLAMAVFRAVETRTTVVRAANTGISCFIGPGGDVYAALEPHTAGSLAAPIRLCDTVTPYVRFGDAFALICLVLVVAIPVLLLVLRRAESPSAP